MLTLNLFGRFDALLDCHSWCGPCTPAADCIGYGGLIGRVLVLDVGTSGLRAAIVSEEARIIDVCYAALPPTLPSPGLVEIDPVRLASTALGLAREVLGRSGPVACVGITNQRASTILWDRRSGEPVAPGIGWQDLRTAGRCFELQVSGVHVSPNASATKLEHLLDTARNRSGIDAVSTRDLCFGTIDSWLAWALAGGPVPGLQANEASSTEPLHVTDWTNAGVTGLVSLASSGWDPTMLQLLGIPPEVLPGIVDSSGVVGAASALGLDIPIASIVGDQQASLVGQGCTTPGMAKITFGTGGMLDQCGGSNLPEWALSGERGPQGTIPVIAWARDGKLVWGTEAIMISAGEAVDWLCRGLGLLDSPAASEDVASACDDSGDVWFVPALIGLGTPVWDFGARGGFFGITRGARRPHLVRAVLEGIAHRGADLIDAAEADSGLPIGAIRVDGGMTANRVFLQALADAAGRVVEVSRVTEATTLGAAFLAGIACGIWQDEAETASLWSPSLVVDPRWEHDASGDRDQVRARWHEARDRALATIPELSVLHF